MRDRKNRNIIIGVLCSLLVIMGIGYALLNQRLTIKGQEIIIIGRLQNRSWTDDKGQKKYATDIIVEEADFCGSKKDNDNSTPKKENTKPNVDMGFSAEDDDLPF